MGPAIFKGSLRPLLGRTVMENNPHSSWLKEVRSAAAMSFAACVSHDPQSHRMLCVASCGSHCQVRFQELLHQKDTVACIQLRQGPQNGRPVGCVGSVRRGGHDVRGLSTCMWGSVGYGSRGKRTRFLGLGPVLLRSLGPGSTQLCPEPRTAQNHIACALTGRHIRSQIRLCQTYIRSIQLCPKQALKAGP